MDMKREGRCETLETGSGLLGFPALRPIHYLQKETLMNANSWLYRMITMGLGTVMMSFAWPIRGQFGHEWGALITGAMAAAIVTTLIPVKSYRQVFTKAVFFGALGFVIGGENIPYGQLINRILAMPDLKNAMPELLTVLFIGASWGMIGAGYLGFGMSERPVSKKDYCVILAAGAAVLVFTDVFSSNACIIAAFTALICFLYFYNAARVRSRMVPLLGVYGLVGFGAGFLISVIILYYGTNGHLGGPSGWWTLRDQIWGGLGGFALMFAAWRARDYKLLPAGSLHSKLEKAGFIFFVPFICGWNTYDVYEKWFTSSPPAPGLALAGTLIAAGVMLLLAWTVYYLRLPNSRLVSPAENPVILGSIAFFTLYLMVLAIAKTVVYSGWARWETGFTLFLFVTALILLVLPFILLAPQEE